MAKKPEQLMWDRLSRSLHPYALCQRHEDNISPDIPDVSFVRKIGGASGWIELKTIEKWSVGRGCSTPVTKLPHLRPGQVNWLNSRAKLGAHVWMLLWVRESNDWLWIPGTDVTHDMIDVGLKKAEWLDIAEPFVFGVSITEI